MKDDRINHLPFQLNPRQRNFQKKRKKFVEIDTQTKNREGKTKHVIQMRKMEKRAIDLRLIAIQLATSFIH